MAVFAIPHRAERQPVETRHSTMLLKLDGRFWLTDPVFSERASPFQWMGPKRFHAPLGVGDRIMACA
jgi:L-ascorbate metabolism protein UlaG (beta-lactamase superfamily)